SDGKTQNNERSHHDLHLKLAFWGVSPNLPFPPGAFHAFTLLLAPLKPTDPRAIAKDGHLVRGSLPNGVGAATGSAECSPTAQFWMNPGRRRTDYRSPTEECGADVLLNVRSRDRRVARCAHSVGRPESGRSPRDPLAHSPVEGCSTYRWR